ncbi:hypothetical protein [Thalassoglobus sp.]|uniref:hypothetical protein n=1 Tax=Thalassoglobus sp. TaxID=2795869 RepID=UPI003AA8B84F
MEFTNQATAQKETAAMIAFGRLFDLERKINAKTSGRIKELQVESTGDSIIISGSTTTYYSKQLATQLALDEFGELILENEIDVS